jgi:hypothetical protein
MAADEAKAQSLTSLLAMQCYHVRPHARGVCPILKKIRGLKTPRLLVHMITMTVWTVLMGGVTELVDTAE